MKGSAEEKLFHRLAEELSNVMAVTRTAVNSVPREGMTPCRELILI